MNYAEFFEKVFDYALVIQVLVISSAVVLVLSPVKKKASSILLTLLKIAVFFWAEIFMIATFAELAKTVPIFRGNGFLFGYVIGVCVYAQFFCRYNRKSRWIMATSILAVSLMTLEIAFAFSKLFEELFSQSVAIDFMGLGKCFFMILVILFAALQLKFSMRNYDDLPVAALILVTGGNVLSIILNFVYESFFVGAERLKVSHLTFAGVFFATLFIINLSIYVLTYFLYRERAEVILLRGEKRFAEDNLEMMKMSEKSLDTLRRLKHDLNNQLSYLQLFIKNKQFDEAETFINSLISVSEDAEPFLDCGNKEIDAIVNMEVSKAAVYEMELDVNVVVPPRLPYPPSILCSIIGNLVDNAVEANVRYGIKDKIGVTINKMFDYLYICVDNRIPADVNKEEVISLNTHKSDPTRHGLGTQIVRKLAEKYNGYVIFSIKDERFLAEVMLSLVDVKYEEIDKEWK